MRRQAGWHRSHKLLVRPNITLVPMPPRCPELNPIENFWQFMRHNWLTNRVFRGTTTFSTIAATLGTSSSISPGASCPSDYGSGRTGSDQGVLVLAAPALQSRARGTRSTTEARSGCAIFLDHNSFFGFTTRFNGW
jgi:hypothetical protein